MFWSFLLYHTYHLPFSKMFSASCPISEHFFFYLLAFVPYTLQAVVVMISIILTYGDHYTRTARLMSLFFTLQLEMNWNFDLNFKLFSILVFICSISCYFVSKRNSFPSNIWEFWGQRVSFVLSVPEIDMGNWTRRQSLNDNWLRDAFNFILTIFEINPDPICYRQLAYSWVKYLASSKTNFPLVLTCYICILYNLSLISLPTMF